jgi:Zn-dependent peptidase ImmA (M78 family)
MFTRDVINNVADLVRSALKLTCPYNPEQAVERLKGNIKQTINNMAIDASIKNHGSDSFIIDLNKHKPFLREKFTIAHELGHLFLHMGFLINKKLWDSISDDGFQDSVYYRMSSSYTQEESEANEFAAVFLMPKSEFKEQVYSNLSKNDTIDIPKIASYFDVSGSAALTRARWLGYVRW